MPIDMSLLKEFRCILTVRKGGLVRQQQKDGSWVVVQSPERLQVLYRPSAVDRVSAEAGMLTCKVPGGDPSCGVRPCSIRRGLCRGSVSGCANFLCST
jgi:hypothetical protein